MSQTHDETRTTVPARCRNCANREQVTGACGHADRQALASYFAERDRARCPGFTPLDS